MNTKLVTLLACCASLFAAGCTETVVREVPATDPAPADAAERAAAAPTPVPVAAPGATLGGEPSTVTVAGEPSTETDGEEPSAAAPDTTAVFDDPDAVAGEPGASVDCAATVPCRWLSEDGGLAVTVTRADHGGDGALEVDFRLDTTRETTLALGETGSAIDGSGASLAPTRRSLEGGRGETALEAAPGRPLAGRLAYAGTAREGLARWSLALVDNGFAREARFVDLPVGRLAAEASDCALALPCTWTSPDGATRVTLTVVGGFEAERRLVAGFEVESADDLALVLDGAEALGADGTRFEGRMQSLGQVRDHESVGAQAIAGVALAAGVDFFRTSATPDALAWLSLELHRDAPVPRWDVRFENVPLGGVSP